MDGVYEAAVNRLQELESEAKTLRDFIEMYRGVRQRLGLDSKEALQNSTESDASRSSTVEGVSTAGAASTDGTRRPRTMDNPPPHEVVAAARRIIAERGEPMGRRDLHGALMRAGLEVKGADPVKALGTMLWRANDQLIHLKGYGYWPIEEPYRPAMYDPDPTFDMSERGTQEDVEADDLF